MVPPVFIPVTGRIERIANPKYPHEYVGSLDKLLRGKRQAADFLAGLPRPT